MIEYFDAYLAPLIDKTPEWETRAIADVALLGTFPEPWGDKLAMLRAYVLCCLESNASDEDVFTLKLKQYQKEFETTLRQAQAVVNVASATPALSLSVLVERA